MSKNISEGILEIINYVLDNNNKPKIESAKLDDKLQDDIGFDSLNLAELTVRIENEFGIDIFEDGLVFTFGEILKKLEN